MKNSLIITLCVMATLMLTGCFKEVSYRTNYVIRPYLQIKNQGIFTPQSKVLAYAFGVDTTDWMVASYADALAGVVTSKRDLTNRLSAAVTSTPYPVSDTIPSSSSWIHMELNNMSMMIVAVDSLNKLYAYRQQNFVENLSPYFMALQLRSWRNTYTEGGWRVVNEFYVPPVPDPAPDDSGGVTPSTE